MDANASIQMASAVASVYAQASSSKPTTKAGGSPAAQTARAEDRYVPSAAQASKDADSSNSSAKSNSSLSLSNTTDRVELSNSWQDLKPAGTSGRPVDTRLEPKPEDPDQASQWSQDRLARLDHLALLVKEGHYRIEPFMVDEIALRLARAMASI